MAETVFTKEEIARAKKNGVNYLNLYNRVNNLFWEKEDAITTAPIKPNTSWMENKEKAEANGVSRYKFTRAIKEGLSVEEAIKPIHRVRGRSNKISKELVKLAEANGISYETLRARKRNLHWSDERAINQPIGKRVRQDIYFGSTVN